MATLDDAPSRDGDEDPVAARDARRMRQMLLVQTLMGGATQLEKCPECLALLMERDVDEHRARAHGGGWG